MEKQMDAAITRYEKMKIVVENEVALLDSSSYLSKKEFDTRKSPTPKMNLGHIHRVLFSIRKFVKEFLKKEKCFRFDEKKSYKRYSYTDIINEFNKRY